MINSNFNKAKNNLEPNVMLNYCKFISLAQRHLSVQQYSTKQTTKGFDYALNYEFTFPLLQKHYLEQTIKLDQYFLYRSFSVRKKIMCIFLYILRYTILTSMRQFAHLIT